MKGLMFGVILGAAFALSIPCSAMDRTVAEAYKLARNCADLGFTYAENGRSLSDLHHKLDQLLINY